MDDRLPEMLWAVLFVAHLDREIALNVFRQLAEYAERQSANGSFSLFSITHSGLAHASPEIQDQVLAIITRNVPDRQFLSSLLLFSDLPARNAWIKAVGMPIGPVDWTPLMVAVAKALDHQSQEATDCRWAKVRFLLATGLLHLPNTEAVREWVEYPHFGDQRKVRPSIRATEGAFSRAQPEQSVWSSQFWAKCLAESPCLRPSDESHQRPSMSIGTTPERLNGVHVSLIRHASITTTTSSVDAKHDTVFGTALYALSLLQELMRPGLSHSALARMALRCVLECYVTLAYLISRNDPTLWQSYRVYGAGQAKLSFLKFERAEEPSATYISAQTLESLANEDRHQEFLKIDLGHWDKSNLRTMSEIAGVKCDYDAFYSWPSAYSHGQWGAVRDVVFTTCFNPLHRLHRIPAH